MEQLTLEISLLRNWEGGRASTSQSQCIGLSDISLMVKEVGLNVVESSCG